MYCEGLLIRREPVEELEALLKRAQSGDLDAYGEIVRRFQDMAVGYANAILNDSHLAEDIAQEAFTEAFLNLSSVYGPHAFPAWLRKIILKFCDRLTRKKKVQFVTMESVGGLRSRDKGPGEILESKNTKELVQVSLQSLPEQERTVVNLFYINELSQKEVAAFLEVPVTTVNFRLHSARKRLKKEFIDMARETMKDQRPSKDQEFADKVQNRLQAVEKLHDGLLPELQQLLAKALKRDVAVEISEAHEWMFGYYVQSLGKFSCDYCFTMEPMEGRVCLDLSLPLCAAILNPEVDDEAVDSLVQAWLATPLGEGWMESLEFGPREHRVTPSERETLNSMAKGLISALEAAWRPVCEVRVVDVELETVPEFVEPHSAGIPVIHLIMKAKSEGHQDLEIYLCYPVSMLEGVIEEMG